VLAKLVALLVFAAPWDASPVTKPNVKAGKLRALLVFGNQRLPELRRAGAVA
jgi:tripartite-type tricarboxylate transporter receptor subunit TctC